ncbi:Protein DVU_0534 [uncultured delta proteobacterium]|uniref:Protein DVU_0534 n=1 Tax=uncultured delta proteobacterium TaxID=34034 RepID=A0A212J2I8_9DELT|nr:Protein DVU_0534 [uncultured delta proteobacterium]
MMRAQLNQIREQALWLKSRINRENLLELFFSIPWTPANIITAVILGIGGLLLLLRFTLGIGAISNLDDTNPWGIWIAFDLLCGVALAAGGYTTSAACYLFGLKRYHSAVRPAITTAFLGYLFVVFALHFDVGQPWRLVYPVFLSQGTTSVLFEVGLCVFIYLMVLFIEWTPAAFEWLGWGKIRGIIVKLTLPLTILGVVLSTMHQSSLGALFLTSPGKLHPLWYSSFLPVFFFVSSMFAGMSMVIFEGMLAHKGMHHKMDEAHNRGAEEIAFGFSRGAAFIMAGYLCIRIYDIAMNNTWGYLATGYGALWVVELAGFVAAPMILYATASRERRIGLARLASVLAVAGIILNRFIICLIAFNWQLPSAERYFPSFLEVLVSVFIVTMIITAYRLIATFMPVLFEHPDYREDH